ncbi:MAG: restriction endonuclease [Ignavibacterium sp.]|jgi:restriction system protein|nr:restriction endonuclease [Ignavibacterium sp.]MDX9713306.1 restriction endonuclease [Ignavibacteriaceae bacterium]GIK21406.1 MAG: Mrr restriction system protein [Ignavibacteriota bacterium]
METKNLPKNLKFFNPVLEIIRKLGGSANATEVKDELIERFKISDEVLTEKYKSGVLKIDNQIAWAKVYLTESGFIDVSNENVWTLTEKGLNENPSDEELIKIFHHIHSEWGKRGKGITNHNGDDDKEIIEQFEYKEEFLNKLKSMSPESFERFCQRILRESGFKKVVVKGRSGDGGIDGEGILEINPLISIKVIFQSKRYKDSVSPSYLRDFRGAMQGRAEKGLFITTGRFSQEAKLEATRDGVPPIELIDGYKLVELCEKHKLGLKPKLTYEIDEDFFEEFK